MGPALQVLTFWHTALTAAQDAQSSAKQSDARVPTKAGWLHRKHRRGDRSTSPFGAEVELVHKHWIRQPVPEHDRRTECAVADTPAEPVTSWGQHANLRGSTGTVDISGIRIG
eukprot:COSAG02_NODE_13_length_57813_cov_14.298276_37_plen_113_part_00